MSKYFLCDQDELNDMQARGFTINHDNEELNLLVIKHGAQINAYQNRCPHLGIELNWQPDQFMSLEGTHIQCSTHGALFNVEDGFCIAGPCSGQSLDTLNIELNDAGVYLSVDS